MRKMQDSGGLDASRANLYVLLEALKSGRLAIEIEKAALGNLQSPSVTGMKIPPEHLDYLIKLAVAGQGRIDAGEFLEGLNLKEIDATALLVRNDAAAVLYHLSVLSKAGLVKFKETGPEIKGFKATDRERFAEAVNRLNDSFLASMKAFVVAAGTVIKGTNLARYPTLRAELAGQAAADVEMLDKEYIMAQHNIKFTSVVPARDGLEAMMAALQAARQAVQDIKNVLLAPSSIAISVSRSFLEAQLKLVNPTISVDASRFAELSPGCAGLFKEYPSTRFESSFNTLMSGLTAARDCIPGTASDLFLYFIETKQFAVALPEQGSKERKETRRLFNQLVKAELVSHLASTWPWDAGSFLAGIDKDEKLSALLPKVLKHALEQEERQLMAFTAKNDIPGGEDRLSAVVASYREKLLVVSAWCDEMQRLTIGDYASSINPLRESLGHQEQEIERFQSKMAFFFHETKSQEDKVKIRDDVKKILANIDALVNKFEAGIGLILNKSTLDLELLGTALTNFKTQYQALLDQLNELLGKYDAFKLLNLVEEIKQFFEKRNEKANLVVNMVLVDLRENVLRITRTVSGISSTLKEGSGFSLERGKLGDVEFDEKVAGIATTIDGAMNEEIVEDEFITKKRLSLIEERLSELEVIKKNLLDKKDKLLFRLVKAEDKGKFLEERKIGECIICYEPITTLDEEVVVCPHCGRFGHYLCLAYWYEKYSICPVCHGKLTRPEDAVPGLQGGGYSP